MRKRILIVEDHAALAGLYCLLLEDRGYDVFVAEDLATARARLALPPRPDLVLVDVLLPDGSGLDLCREVKGRWPQLPVGVVTGIGGPVEREAARRAGADLFLTKFGDAEDFEAAITALLTHGSTSAT